MWKVDPLQILLAVLLDLILGDPRGWPHITRFTGILSEHFENLLTRFFARTVLLGFIFWIFICGTMLFGFLLLYRLLYQIHPLAAWGLEIVILYQTIAAMDLSRHLKAVFQPLHDENLMVARAKLSMIVGRDTQGLNESEISRAALESLAESAHDGFVAPLFWGTIAGVPGALIYRTANTLDSIVGHRNERYEYFGKISARIDDVLNWIPARICAMISLFLCGFKSTSAVCKEAIRHASPNAGWSEAAVAHALGVRLGGDNFYDGKKNTGPIFHSNGQQPKAYDILAGLRWFWMIVGIASLLMMLISFLLTFKPV